jgi:hypothetical protein
LRCHGRDNTLAQPINLSSKKDPVPMTTPTSHETGASGSVDPLVHLEALAEEMRTWAHKVFLIAATEAATARQSATLAREAMSLGKGYADMVARIERRHDDRKAKKKGTSHKRAKSENKSKDEAKGDINDKGKA